MEAEVQVYRDRFANIGTSLGHEVNLSMVLIEVSTGHVQL
jgi:hypothetical protein